MSNFNHEGTYKCVCGKEFLTSNSFNGHKTHCPEHLILKHGSLNFYLTIRNQANTNSNETNKQRLSNIKQQELQQWIEEKHQCETCGKVMTEKYGSGRFCCKSCANTRNHSLESRYKTYLSVIQNEHISFEEFCERVTEKSKNSKKVRKYKKRNNNVITREIYEQSPKYCVICLTLLPYERRNSKLCGNKECKHKYLSECSRLKVQRFGGNINKAGSKNYKRGYYKGIWCDSSLELAFLTFMFDKGIVIERNSDSFPYYYKEKWHNYYPDFKLNNRYIEIKGRIFENTFIKFEQFPKDKTLVVLYKLNMTKMVKYCKETYGNKFWETLYDA